jgi:hypothetical protein
MGFIVQEKIEIDTDKIDDAALALFQLTLHDSNRVWKDSIGLRLGSPSRERPDRYGSPRLVWRNPKGCSSQLFMR